MGWMMNWGDHNSGYWGLGMILMAVFWVALIAVAVWAVIRLSRHDQSGPPVHMGPGQYVESPRQILDRRFAAGEIDKQTYAEMRRVLEGRGVTQNPPS